MIDKGMLNFMKSLLERNGFNVAEDNLKFQVGNSKLNDIITFSLPAGHSCPFAPRIAGVVASATPANVTILATNENTSFRMGRK